MRRTFRANLWVCAAFAVMALFCRVAAGEIPEGMARGADETGLTVRIGLIDAAARRGAHEALDGEGFSKLDAKRVPSDWHIDIGLRTGVTRLHSTKQQLDRRLDLPLKLDVFGVFRHPTTPIDRKTDLALCTQYLGIGREVDDWLSWTWFFGAGVGADQDHQRFLNLNLDVDFKYGYYYSGVVFEMYPWGLPRRGAELSLEERLYASRPYMLAGAEVGYVSAEGRGHFSVAPFVIYEDKVTVRDWVFSFLVGAGWGVPLSERWSWNLSMHYSFHLYRPEEYNTLNFVSTFRYRL